MPKILKLWQLISVVCMAVLFIGATGAAQTTFGSITGTVNEPSGAVLPNAAVTAVNEATGTIRHESTGSTGVFNVPNLDVWEEGE